MLKPFTLTLLLIGLLAADATHAQQRPEYAIYDTLVKKYKDRMPSRFTSNKVFKHFNFKNLKEHDLGPADTLNPAWKSFISSIDTSKFHSGVIDSAFFKKYTYLLPTDRYIRFSPIILSDDKTKAVCGVLSFDNYSAGEKVYLFEKKGKRWVYRRSYFISVS